MQIKFSKKFIYNWFKEDFHGEFTLFKLNSSLASVFLKRAWDYLLRNRNKATASLFGKFFLPIYMNYVAYTLRNQFLSVFSNCNNIGVSNISNFKIRHFTTINLIKTYLLTISTFKPWSTGAIFNNTITASRFFNLTRKNTRIFLIKRNKYLVKKKYLLRSKKRRFIRNLLGCNKYFFRRRRHYLSTYKQNRLLNFKNIQKKRLIAFKNKKNILMPTRTLFWRNSFLLPFSTRKTTVVIDKCRLLLKTKCIRKFWDNLSYRLKKASNWLSGKKSNSFNIFSWVRLAKFDFRGVFKKRTMYVKKHEISKLLQFRRFLRFHLIESPLETTKRCKFILTTTKNLSLPIPASLEYLLNTIILRSNFFQNGYIVNTLLKRQMFTVNGASALNIALVHPWDIIAVKRPLWWVVYSRFLNFFSAFITHRVLTFNSASGSTPFKGLSLNTKLNFLKRFVKNRRLLVKGPAARFRGSSSLLLLKLQNYIFSLPPTYMEISFKLFVIIVFKILTLTSDQTRLFNISSIKQLQPSYVLNSAVTS